ncbi:hypothetical protein HPHPH10_0664 [Helicobacter pylori Hp H-10]|nr:hypothetical protein HPHPH10_0664 [Helicobacter pylori Hp H-10]
MMRSLKNKGALKNAHPTTRRNKPCQKDKNTKKTLNRQL